MTEEGVSAIGSAMAATAGASRHDFQKNGSRPRVAIRIHTPGPLPNQHRPAYTRMPARLKATLTL